MNKQTSVLHYQKAPATLPNIAVSPFKSSLRFSDIPMDDVETVLKVKAEHPELAGMDKKALKAFWLKKRDEHRREMAEIEQRLRTNREELRLLNERDAALGEMAIWSAESGLKIERPDGPSFRKLRKAVAEGRTAYLGRQDALAVAPAMDFEKEVFCQSEILVIEHDWAAALKGANVENAVIRLPYDVCAFEFKFAGRPVIAFAIQVDTEIAFCPAICCGDLWIILDSVLPLEYNPLDERLSCMVELAGELSDQIKAACIALDAEVAQSDAVREPHSGSSGGDSAQPLKPHHVISLAHRRARPPALGPSDGTGKRKRLHFRRGHWRHFDDHKTWIKWMLVGDPDLSFVEKEYRL